MYSLPHFDMSKFCLFTFSFFSPDLFCQETNTFIHSEAVEHLGCFQVFTIVGRMNTSILVRSPVVYVQEFLLGIYLRVELLNIQLHEILPNCFPK